MLPRLLLIASSIAASGCLGPHIQPPMPVPLSSSAGERTVSVGLRAPKPRHGVYVAGTYAPTEVVRLGASVSGAVHRDSPTNEEVFDYEPVATELDGFDADLTIGLEQPTGRWRVGAFLGGGGGYVNGSFSYCEGIDSGEVCYEAPLPVDSGYLRASAGAYGGLAALDFALVGGIRFSHLTYLSEIPKGEVEGDPQTIFDDPRLLPELFALARLGSSSAQLEAGMKVSPDEPLRAHFGIRLIWGP